MRGLSSIGKRKREEIAGVVRQWRESAMRWIRKMPLAMRALDGGVVVRLPEPGSDDHFRAAGMEKGPGGSWSSGANSVGPAAHELSRLSRRIAVICAPLGFRVGSLLRFEHRLDRGTLPSVAHYMLAEDAEFEVVEIELALGLETQKEPTMDWEEPLNMGPRRVLGVLVRNLGEIKVGRIVGMLPSSLLKGTKKPADKVHQVGRWIEELAGRNPPLAEATTRTGYYRATDHGKAWQVANGE